MVNVLLRWKMIVLAGTVLLSACTSVGGGQLGGPVGADNFASGSRLGSELTRGEQKSHRLVFLDAIENGQTGSAKSWRQGSASGTIIPGDYKVGNLRADASVLLDFRPGLFLSQKYETDLGDYVLIRNANIRMGPSTDTKVAEMLESGDGVEVVGRVTDKPWMLVLKDGYVRGFIYQKLLVRRPGTELDLAGGPVRSPLLCRSFVQDISVAGRADRWGGAVCKDGQRWKLHQQHQAMPTSLF